MCAMWKQKAAQVIPIVISSTGVISKSLSQSLTRLNLHPNTYIQLKKKSNSWHMFNCKKLFILQVRPPSLILLITISQDRWIFPSQSCEVKYSIIIIIIIIIIIATTITTIIKTTNFLPPQPPSWSEPLCLMSMCVCIYRVRQKNVYTL
jgi:hypothetical protein